MITPAKSHPGVIIAAVAARDTKRAESYARTYNIPIIHPSYQGEKKHPPLPVMPGYILADITQYQPCLMIHPSMRYTSLCQTVTTTNGLFAQ